METEYHTLYQQSLADPETFWDEQAKKFVSWSQPWEKVLQGDFQYLDIQWFVNGKLNACYNCVDRHLPKKANDIALIWQGDDPKESKTITYQALHAEICRLANLLKKFKIKKGDRVCIYMPMIPEAVIAMLACARIGAIHSVVFGGFSPESLQNRILDADCRLVITANEGVRGGKIIPLKKNVDKALLQCPDVHNVIVFKRTENEVPWIDARDYWYHNEITTVSAECPCEEMDANDPLFVLYTSGSTGKPKGILHGTGGYLVYAAITYQYIFDHRPSDIYWCTADVGWITGHTYIVYGPLANGATVLIYEGIPNYPMPARYWEIIDKYKVSVFYTSPTAIRALRREGDEWLQKTQRTSLRILGTVGEPINPDVWDWYYQVVGRSQCPIVDTYWQTETGGIVISPVPNVTPLVPGSATWPFFGIKPEILNDQGQSVLPGKMGKLVFTQPWPGMMQTIYGDRKRFEESYFKEFSGKYLTGDEASYDDNGCYWIAGRNDDVLKISGHRLGSGELENAFLSDARVAEAAVVPVADDIKGEDIYAFVTLKEGAVPTDALKKELIQHVRETIGPIATPRFIQWADALPKTRSGKIMRRLLRKIANKQLDELGDTSTLSDPQVVDSLISERGKIA